jgi:hypothetical protein
MRPNIPMLVYVFAVVAFVFSPVASKGSIIARWTFETSTPADVNNSSTISSLAADVGTGTASGFHTSAGTDWSTPVGNGSANSLSANDWGVGDYFQFRVSTVGEMNIKVSWDQVSSGTGPTSFKLQYGTDGNTFTDFASYTVSTDSGSWVSGTYKPAFTFSYDLSAITGLNNASDVYFRLVNLATVSGTAGTSRYDNFTVEAVPEPTNIALGLFSIAVVGAFSRRCLCQRKASIPA